MVIGPEPPTATREFVEESATAQGLGVKAVEGRSLGQIAWMRLKRDKIAIAGGVFVVFVLLTAIFAPLIVKLFGNDPYAYNNDLIDPNLGGLPIGARGGMSWDHIFGVEPVSGRDVFANVILGSRISLTVAFAAAALSLIIGVVMGLVAGFTGGWIDALISRLMDLLLAFPQLLFSIALVSVLPDSAFGLGGTTLRMAVLIVVIGFFGWPYIGRIVRGQVLSLREREFVEASRSLGARSHTIIFRELLPNLLAPILVYTTLIIPTNILSESALSFLGVGVRPPQQSWGSLLSSAVSIYQYDPAYMIIPGVAIFLTVLAFNLFGDGLRDALDPKAR